MCWRHQNFQMPTTTHQTTVPSTHPKIQSPKSTGQSTWSSHLRASHLRALFYTLLSHKWKWNTCGYFLNFAIDALSQNIMSMIVWKNSFFCSSFHQNFQNLFFCTVSSRKFSLTNFQTIMVKIFKTFVKKTPKQERHLFGLFFKIPE